MKFKGFLAIGLVLLLSGCKDEKLHEALNQYVVFDDAYQLTLHFQNQSGYDDSIQLNPVDINLTILNSNQSIDQTMIEQLHEELKQLTKSNIAKLQHTLVGIDQENATKIDDVSGDMLFVLSVKQDNQEMLYVGLNDSKDLKIVNGKLRVNIILSDSDFKKLYESFQQIVTDRSAFFGKYSDKVPM